MVYPAVMDRIPHAWGLRRRRSFTSHKSLGGGTLSLRSHEARPALKASIASERPFIIAHPRSWRPNIPLHPSLPTPVALRPCVYIRSSCTQTIFVLSQTNSLPSDLISPRPTTSTPSTTRNDSSRLMTTSTSSALTPSAKAQGLPSFPTIPMNAPSPPNSTPNRQSKGQDLRSRNGLRIVISKEK